MASPPGRQALDLSGQGRSPARRMAPGRVTRPGPGHRRWRSSSSKPPMRALRRQRTVSSPDARFPGPSRHGMGSVDSLPGGYRVTVGKLPEMAGPATAGGVVGHLYRRNAVVACGVGCRAGPGSSQPGQRGAPSSWATRLRQRGMTSDMCISAASRRDRVVRHLCGRWPADSHLRVGRCAKRPMSAGSYLRLRRRRRRRRSRRRAGWSTVWRVSGGRRVKRTDPMPDRLEAIGASGSGPRIEVGGLHAPSYVIQLPDLEAG
jgi:hypothetical protein